MQCPDCQRKLKEEATSCACGWVKPAPGQAPAQSRRPQCARCPSDATVRVKIGDTWTNLCVPCEVAEKTEQAKEYCASIGVKTPADIRAWLGKNKLMVKRAPVLEREPGCDDE